MSQKADAGKNINKRFSTLELISGLNCYPNRPRHPVDLDVHGGARIRKDACIQGTLRGMDAEFQGNFISETVDANSIIGDMIIGDCGMFGTITVDHIRAISFHGDLFGNVCGNIKAEGIMANTFSVDSFEVGNINLNGDFNVNGNLVLDKLCVEDIEANCITVEGISANTFTVDDFDVSGDINIAGNLNGMIQFEGNLDVDMIMTNVIRSNIFINTDFTSNTFCANLATIKNNVDVEGDINVAGNLYGMVQFEGNLDVEMIRTNKISANMAAVESIQVNTSSTLTFSANILEIDTLEIGNIQGNIQGDVIGDITGNVLGDVLGNVKGCVLGNVKGDVEGNINATEITVSDSISLSGDLVISGNITTNNLQANLVVENIKANTVTANVLTTENETVLGNVVVSGNLIVSGAELNVTADITGSTVALEPRFMDAFGRQKVSNPFTLLDNKFLTSSEPESWDTYTEGGATFTHSPGHIALDVTTTGDKIVRQSRLYTPYQPGKGLTILATGTLEVNGGVTGTTGNVVSRIGYFDDETIKGADDTSGSNGYFYELDGTTLYVVERTDVSGSVVENRIPQSAWNVDKFDGTGPSGLTLDPSKRQIFVIELEWLGVGTVVMGLFISRRLWFTHIFQHANLDSSLPYISRPTLPVRYEIESTGDAGAGEMVQICSTVLSDGGFQPKGSVYAAGNSSPESLITTDEKPIVGIRLKSGHRRVTASLTEASSVAAAGGTYEIKLYRYLSPSVDPLSGGTWNAVNPYSAVELNTDAPGTIDPSADGAVPLNVAYISNQTRINFSDASERFGVVITSNIAGNSDVLLLTGKSLSGTVSRVSAALQWQEFE